MLRNRHKRLDERGVDIELAPLATGSEVRADSHRDSASVNRPHVLYNALDPRKFRLLRPRWRNADGIEATNGECSHTVLDWQLAEFSLSAEPVYRALSYCWGREEATQDVKINTILFNVQPNLYNFLAAFRENEERRGAAKEPSCDSSWIFIDAICINQEDLAERGAQVLLMGDIYRNATEVIGWLGIQDYGPYCGITDDSEIQQWQKTLFRIQLWQALEAAKDLRGRRRDAKTREAARKRFLKGEGIDEDQARIIVDPLVGEQSYWSRLWVVQEVLLAKGLTFWYRRLRVPWEVLYALLFYGYPQFETWTADPNSSHIMTKLDERTPGLKDFAGTFMQALSLLHSKYHFTDQARSRQLDLSTAILSFIDKRCSVPHDNIFGLLGMTKSVFIPNYEYSILLLYINALLEGFLEIQQQFCETGRPLGKESAIQSMAYAALVARTLEIPLHHSNTSVAYAYTKVCHEIVGLKVGPTFKSWAHGSFLSHAWFQKGQMWRIRSSAVRMLHTGVNIFDTILKDSDDEQDFKDSAERLKALYLRNRWPTRYWSERIEAFPTMKLEQVKRYVDALIKPDDPYQKQSWVPATMIEKALGTIREEISTLTSSQDPSDHDRASGLSELVWLLVDTLETKRSNAHHALQRSSQQEPPVLSYPNQAADCRTVMQCLISPCIPDALYSSWQSTLYKALEGTDDQRLIDRIDSQLGDSVRVRDERRQWLSEVESARDAIRKLQDALEEPIILKEEE